MGIIGCLGAGSPIRRRHAGRDSPERRRRAASDVALPEDEDTWDEYTACADCHDGGASLYED